MILKVLFGVFLFLLSDVRAQESCRTPLNKTGICKKIMECDVMVGILNFTNQIPFSSQYNYSVQLLKDSVCGIQGVDPRICCEEINDSSEIIPSTFAPTPIDVSNHPNIGLLDHRLCGVFTDDKMIPTEKIGVFDHPWMALIAYQVGGNIHPEFRCGGTIINKRYILTAAHCVTSLPSNLTLLGVRVGEHDITKPTDCDLPDDPINKDCTNGFQEFGVESIHSHPDFSVDKFQNDIALLRLDKVINFEPYHVRPICLPIGPAQRVYTEKVSLTGWGIRKSGPQNPEILQTKIPLVSNEECAGIYNKNTRFIGYKQICAGGGNGKSSCIGDDGGPLQNPGNYNNSSRYVQYGIFSYGLSECGRQEIPGVYTSVSYYMDWILNTMRA